MLQENDPIGERVFVVTNSGLPIAYQQVASAYPPKWNGVICHRALCAFEVMKRRNADAIGPFLAVMYIGVGSMRFNINAPTIEDAIGRCGKMMDMLISLDPRNEQTTFAQRSGRPTLVVPKYVEGCYLPFEHGDK
jgi:hypothetical protein